jgi:hypothetical protein
VSGLENRKPQSAESSIHNFRSENFQNQHSKFTSLDGGWKTHKIERISKIKFRKFEARIIGFGFLSECEQSSHNHAFFEGNHSVGIASFEKYLRITNIQYESELEIQVCLSQSQISAE